MTGEAPRLRDLDLPPGFDSGDDILESFYVPALSRAVDYDRSAGYFRSSALKVAAQGVSRFIHGGGRMRLLVGAKVEEDDAKALTGAVELPGSFADRLATELVPDDEVARRRLEVLAWLVREGRLDVRVAIAIDLEGHPIVGDASAPYFHTKIGVLRDIHGNGVAFEGSVNETEKGWARNFEQFSVFTSWGGAAAHYDLWARRFEDHWSGKVKGFRVFEFPDAVTQRLLEYAPTEPPNERDVEEPEPPASPAAIARYLRIAPRLVRSEALAEATSGVVLQPHQRQVVARLADHYPRSWLVADEVGLGKTISAGLALRRLLLSGEVRRALILAPANVCRQWQDELFEKFGLWVPRIDEGKVFGAHPDDVRPLAATENPFAAASVLIASSHLARRAEYQQRMLEAGPYDLLIVDEAHHARRKIERDERYRPSRLLELLDRAGESRVARATWLLTATPMQTDQLELRDLLLHVGLAGKLAAEPAFVRYFSELAKTDGEPDWRWLDAALRGTPLPTLGPAEEAFLERVAAKVGPVARNRIAAFGTNDHDPLTLVDELGTTERAELLAWLRQRGPVGQFVTRHGRDTLKRYRERGLLRDPIADRDAEAIPVRFTGEEERLYADLDRLVDRLLDAHGTRRGAGFVLTVYRRRLTSSWEAIRRTLQRRVDRAELALEEEDLLEELEDEELGAAGVDEREAVPLGPDDLAEVRSYIDRIDRLATDSKFERLREHVDEARASGQSLIVFTQFTDTLESLRDRLRHAYSAQLATFTGAGGHEWRDDEGWVGISKRDLIEAVRSGRVSVLLANDAASEGLNLQTCSYLVNFDMPWNPMRAEQRIGRIDRIGQSREVVTVKNYFIPGTVEERVYAALARRIDDFVDLLGNLQPILGATERAFRTIFRAPRSERERVEREQLERLETAFEALEEGGVDIELEDPMPIPEAPPPPVSLDDLREFVRDELTLPLELPGRPVTFDPGRASRDPSSWVALGTYGHPELDEALEPVASVAPGADDALVIAESESGIAAAYRADRTPPELVRHVADLRDLAAATAIGDAELLAHGEVRTAEEARGRRVARVLAAQAEGWQEDIRRRFVALVHEMILSDCARVRHDGKPDYPVMAAWWDLKEDAFSGWQHAETFRSTLGLEVRDLLPAVSDRDRATLSRQRGGQRLYELIDEWRRGRQA